MPRVSVILTTYNRAHLVGRAIQSVLAQTFTDFELIVVDDGSTDNTRQVVAGICDSRLVYIHQSNSGRSAARNRGLSRALGEFIAFLDDDDTYLPEKLAVQVTELEVRPDIDLIVGGWQLVNQLGDVLQEIAPRRDLLLTVETWLFDCPFPHHAALFRKEALGGSIEFDRETEPAEDWDFWLRLASHGCLMEWGYSIVCCYTQHPGNSLKQYKPDMAAAVRMLEKFFAQRDVTSELKTLEGEALARVHLSRGVRWADIGYDADARHEFHLALQRRPDWITSSRADFMALIVHSINNATLVSPPSTLRYRLTTLLPASLGTPSMLDNEILTSMQLMRFRTLVYHGLLRDTLGAYILLAKVNTKEAVRPRVVRDLVRCLVARSVWLVKSKRSRT